MPAVLAEEECGGIRDALLQGTCDAGSGGMLLALALTLLGLGIVLGGARYFGGVSLSAKESKTMLAPLLISSGYSLFSFVFSVTSGGSSGDFFTHGAFGFIIFLTFLFTIGCVVWLCRLNGQEDTSANPWSFRFVYGLNGRRDVAFGLIAVFCVMVGFYAFTLSVVLLCFAGSVFSGLTGAVVKAFRRSWDEQEAAANSEPETLCGFMKEASLRSSSFFFLLGLGESAMHFCLQFVNFILQTVLLAFSLSAVMPATDLRASLVMLFTFQDIQLPGTVSEISETTASASAAFNEVSEVMAAFFLNYTQLWTPSILVAYVTTAVFEMAVVCAVFFVVLSDVLLILAPREIKGCLAKQASKLVSRSVLYTLQVLVAASNSLLLALVWVHPIERPELTNSRSFFYKAIMVVGVPLTLFYVFLSLAMASFLVMKLWGGNDAGLQKITPMLMRTFGIEVSALTLIRGSPYEFAYFCAFFGYWNEQTMAAFEIKERAEIFRLSTEVVRLATLNSLSYPLYLVPFGATVAKFGEYLNQCPIYVEGEGEAGFKLSNGLLSFTYFSEYVLALWICWVTLAEAGEGSAEEGTNSKMEWIGLSVLFCFVCRTLVAFVRDCVVPPLHPETGSDDAPKGSDDAHAGSDV
jgi:hypothetical protein